MAKLELFLLGNPHIYVDGQEVTGFNTRKDRALLAYLAVTGTIHSREALAGLLWSELPEEKARRNLRHSLSHLQKVIGPQWLELERGVTLTQQQPWSVDVHTLRTTVKNLTASPAGSPGHSAAQAQAALQQLLQLYRGEFLQGFYLQQAVYFEEWLVAQREEARLLILRGLETWAERSLAQGMYDVGLTATRRLLQLEPWAETAHGLQMQLLARSGRRAAALAQYEICRRVLATELGVTPLPTTTALYQQIQTGHYPWPDGPSQPVVAPVLAPPIDHTLLTTSPVVPHNLIAPLTAFIGRQTELDFIGQRLGTADCRLLTLVGPGGIGKTRLAQEVGRHLLQAKQTNFPDGIYFVALAGLEPEKNEAGDGTQAETLMAITIAERIGCDLQSGLPPQFQLQNYLRGRRLLLILDNFEHLLAATNTMLMLLTKAPALTILITSRARLNVRGETVLTLAKLSLPQAAGTPQANRTRDSEAELGQTSEAIAMFVQRAQCLDPHFSLDATNLDPVARICQLVDGLPLGIELATSMLSIFSCAELARELAQSLAFLMANTRDLPTDQRTLRAVFERSWRLLAPPEQTLLAKLAIWASTFDWEAARTIAEAPPTLLLRLINQSLVNTTPDGRYVMHGSVCAFALEKLEQTPAQGAAVRIQYAHFYLNFIAQKELVLKSTAAAAVIAQIYLELDNLRLAWRWGIMYRLHTALLAALQAFFFFYELQGLLTEGVEQAESSVQQWLARDEAPSQADEAQINLLIGCLQTCIGAFNGRLGRLPQAYTALEASFTRLQLANSPPATIFCLMLWGILLRGSDIQRAKILLYEAVRQVDTIADNWLNSLVHLMVGETNHMLGNYAEAEAQYNQAYGVAQQADLRWNLASSQHVLGRLHLALGHYQIGEAHLREAIAYGRQQNLQYIWLEASINLGEALRLQGQLTEAQHHYTQCRKEAEVLHDQFRSAQVIWAQGSLAEQMGEYAAAQTLFAESITLGHPNLWIYLLPTLGWALIGLGKLEEAHTYFHKVVTEPPTHALPPITLDAEAGLAYIRALRASAAQPHSEAHDNPTEPVATVFQRVYYHPAATQETRDRVAKLAATLDISLRDATLLSGGPIVG